MKLWHILLIAAVMFAFYEVLTIEVNTTYIIEEKVRQ